MSTGICLMPRLTLATRQFAARVVANGGYIKLASLQRLDAHLVRPLQATGLWGKLRRLNPCLGDNVAASLTPLINIAGNTYDTNHNLVEADYSEALGWKSDGSTKYINTAYTPSESVGGLSAYVRTAVTSSSTGFGLMGAQDAGFTSEFRIIFNRDGAGGTTAGAVQGLWGGTNSTNACGGTASGAGMFHVVRKGASILQFVKNGQSLGSANTAALTPTSATATVTILALNTAGTPGTFMENNARVAGYAVDTGFLAVDCLTFYMIWQDFQTAMNRQV